MGLDSTPGRLELELPEEPPAGTELIGVKSGTRAILLQSAVRKGSRLAGDAEGDVIFAAPTGEFQPHEVILAGDRPIGVFEGRRELSAEAQDPSLREMAASLSLAGLSFAPPEAPAAPAGVLAAPLRAHLPAALDTPERGVQERLLRDLASAWSGELRTDPLWTFLRRRITVHSQGGCPMGPPERGSTDDLGQVHGCPGLYVMDAAAFPGPVGANPSATIAAIAEYKVAKFLESRLGTDDARVRALEALREEARQWVDEGRREKLDPLGSSAPAPRSATPAHLPVGIQFEERMVGTTRGEEPLRTIETSLTARIEDLAEFLARHERESTVPIPIVAGTLTLGSRQLQLDPTQSVLRVMVDRGPDETGTERRTLEYTLVAPGCRLEGKKTIRDDQGADVWEDTTTLVFELFENGELSCGGELRLPASEFFGHQVRSFRVNTDDPARQAWALASFGKFFLGHLVDVYLPALDRLGELGASLLDRGHA
jgi:hypothetical protein